jgi:hypothetical protein
MKRRWKWWDRTRRDASAYLAIAGMAPTHIGTYAGIGGFFVFGSGNTVTGTVINADALQKTDGTGRLFACTATKIYEVTSSAVTDRSAGGGSYTTAAMWNAGQYGDVSIYTSFTNNVQASSSAAFADLAGTPPKARYVCTQSLAVALAAYNDGVNTYEDGIWISDIGDHTTWTPSASNEAANLRLLQTPGPIVGLAPFKGDIIAFKNNSCYRISYVGLPTIWQARLISDNTGAAGQATICVCGDAIVFGSNNGWYVFDGQSVQKIAPGADNLVNSSPIADSFGSVEARGASVTLPNSSYYDPYTGLAHFGSTSKTWVIQMTPGDGYGAFGVYKPHPQTGRCLVRGTAAALVGAGLNAASPGYNSTVCWFLVSSSNSAPYTSAGWTLTSAIMFLQTAYMGDPQTKTYFNRAIPVLCNTDIGAAFSGTGTYQFSEKSDLSDVNSSPTFTAFPSDPRFPVSKTTRFLSFAMKPTANAAVEVEDFIFESKSAGKE